MRILGILAAGSALSGAADALGSALDRPPGAVVWALARGAERLLEDGVPLAVTVAGELELDERVVGDALANMGSETARALRAMLR